MLMKKKISFALKQFDVLESRAMKSDDRIVQVKFL